MRMDAKRGFVPEDEKNFSPESLEKMKTASRHIYYLINEGYDLRQAATFVGNHFLLSERQRLAIMRSLATKEQLADRKRKEIPLAELSSGEVWIDGFNTIITLEVLLSDSVLFSCMDGTIRDLADHPGDRRRSPGTFRYSAGSEDSESKHSVGRAGLQFRTAEGTNRGYRRRLSLRAGYPDPERRGPGAV